MNSDIALPHWKEYSISAENLNLRALILRDRYLDDFPLPALTQHTHSYCEIFICMGDELIIYAGEGSYRLSSGMIALVPAGVPHVCNLAVQEDWMTLGLLIEQRRIRECRNLYGIISGLCQSSIRIFSGQHEIARTLYDISLERVGDENTLPLLLLTQLLHLHKLLPDKSAPVMPVAGRIVEINRIAQLEQLMEAHYSRTITLEQAASQLFISPSQLNRVVQKRYGMTFHRVILERRLNAAEKILRESEMPVEKIAAAVGFQSKSCFYGAFREKYGMTPAKYRASLTGGKTDEESAEAAP